jgi:hypothetical protein
VLRVTRIDVHQHLWPEAFVAALARRTVPPRLRADARGIWHLDLPGEPSSVFSPAAHDPELRARAAEADGVERVLVAPSLPLGVEALRGEEARPLLDAWLEGVLELGAPFQPWGSLPLDGAGPSDVHALLDRGCAGLVLSAASIAVPAWLDGAGPLLEALAERDAPLLVHPGPAPAGRAPAPWWPALTGYLFDLHAARLAWAAWGRRAHPRLRVVFVALAGGAPLHVERVTARGGPAGLAHDPLTFYDTSSYGPIALEGVGRVVGIDQLVLGTDRPMIDGAADHGLGATADAAIGSANPARLLGAGATLAAAA